MHLGDLDFTAYCGGDEGMLGFDDGRRCIENLEDAGEGHQCGLHILTFAKARSAIGA